MMNHTTDSLSIISVPLIHA